MNVRMTASRRRLFLWTAAVLSSLGIKGLAQAHEGEDHSPQVTEDGFTTLVGPASLVDDLGQVLTEQVIIVKDTDNDQLLGVSPFCPHRGCAVDWDQENRQFFCPCHGSRFAPDGQLVMGPAEENLTSYEIRVAENQFQIKAIEP